MAMFGCCFGTVSLQNAGTEKSMFPLPEPQDVFLAAQVKFDDLHRDLRQLGRDLTNMKKIPPEKLIPILRASVFCRCFQDLVLYFGLKPKMGEKEVTAAQFFMLWFEFCADFKARWKKENKNISKESAVRVQPITWQQCSAHIKHQDDEMFLKQLGFIRNWSKKHHQQF
uniref:FH2 domain-containing protein n=1 Tax=Echeneis naucrates TaxID=173247 RepID=A0A665TC45_ECHNA